MKIFLTGAGGYIGAALARRFVKDDHCVSGLVRTPEKAQAADRGALSG